MKKNLFLILAFILSGHLFLLANLRFTAWPEMLFWPYLILHGWLPYRDIAIVHTPLLVIVLSIFYNFAGVGILQQQIAFWLLLPILMSRPKLDFFKGFAIALAVFLLLIFSFGLQNDFYHWAIYF